MKLPYRAWKGFDWDVPGFMNGVSSRSRAGVLRFQLFGHLCGLAARGFFARECFPEFVKYERRPAIGIDCHCDPEPATRLTFNPDFPKSQENRTRLIVSFRHHRGRHSPCGCSKACDRQESSIVS